MDIKELNNNLEERICYIINKTRKLLEDPLRT